jgi:hypothetical protein
MLRFADIHGRLLGDFKMLFLSQDMFLKFSFRLKPTTPTVSKDADYAASIHGRITAVGNLNQP